MHDWSIKNIHVSWKERRAVLDLVKYQGAPKLICEGVTNIKIPMVFDWGPTDCINETAPYLDVKDGILNVENWEGKLSIEMQTGDVIEIEAKTITLEGA